MLILQKTMNEQKLQNEIDMLRNEVRALRSQISFMQYPSRNVFIDRSEFRGGITAPYAFIKSIDDISLTAIGDTSLTNESTNITANFNAIINALTQE